MSETAHDSVKVGLEKLTMKKGPTSRSSSKLDPAERYKMNNKRRGLALIFNQKRFDSAKLGMDEVKTRHGTEVDCDNLEKRLRNLGFKVKVYNDSTKEKVQRKVRKAAEADHSDADCFLLAFLSHGEKEDIYTMDGKMSIQEITDPFKGDHCRSLVGKPKIIILQTCRGVNFDNPATPAASAEREPQGDELMVDAGVLHTLPAGADFIMCYSVAEGYYSFRNTAEGSWYIQDLCKLLEEHGDSLEFTDLLTMVNRKVSMRTVQNSRERAAIGKKQVPCFASMLTKQLYFRPKK